MTRPPLDLPMCPERAAVNVRQLAARHAKRRYVAPLVTRSAVGDLFEILGPAQASYGDPGFG